MNNEHKMIDEMIDVIDEIVILEKDVKEELYYCLLSVVKGKFEIISKSDESSEDEKSNREKFIENFGVILSQMKQNIKCLKMINEDLISLQYENGEARLINISKDSYSAIVYDVIKSI